MKTILAVTAVILCGVLYAGQAEAMLLYVNYPGASCDPDVSGAEDPIANDLEMYNNQDWVQYAVCPIQSVTEKTGWADWEARLAFTGANSSALNCSIVAAEENLSGWTFPWQSVLNKGSAYEFQWSRNAVGYVMTGVGMVCQMQPYSAVTFYGMQQVF